MQPPFHQEQALDPGPRLEQLAAVRAEDRDAHGLEVYSSSYGWIGVKRNGAGYILQFFKACPCNG